MGPMVLTLHQRGKSDQSYEFGSEKPTPELTCVVCKARVEKRASVCAKCKKVFDRQNEKMWRFYKQVNRIA